MGTLLIHPDQSISTIDPDSLPTEGKYCLLEDGRDPVSGKQFRVIARYIKGNVPASMTWAAGVKIARDKFLVGRQHDFAMVKPIMDGVFAERADDPLTPKQLEMVQNMCAALSRTVPYWDVDMDALIAKDDKNMRDLLFRKFVAIDNQGKLTAAMTFWTARYGKPKPRAAFGEPIGLGATSEDALADSTTGDPDDEEPF